MILSRKNLLGSLQADFSATLVDEWFMLGLRHIVLSPGSRSSPLAIALLKHGGFDIHVRLDERSGGFFALGLSKSTNQVVLILTTSGTATTELHPCVVEADQSKVSLLVCTADRPPELHSIGAPQTIDQSNLFLGAVRFFSQPSLASEQNKSTWRSLASRSFYEAIYNPLGPGPVHLNLFFDEPLSTLPQNVTTPRKSGEPWHKVAKSKSIPDLEEFAWVFQQSKRGVILAGQGVFDNSVQLLSQALRWPIIADPISGLRNGSDLVISSAEMLFRVEEFLDIAQPEVVLHLGNPWASRIVNEWIQSLSSAVHLLVDPYWSWIDPKRMASWIIKSDPNLFCSLLLDKVDIVPTNQSWAQLWNWAEKSAQEFLDKNLAFLTETLSEPMVARILFSSLDSKQALFCSSSMPIRDLETFGGHNLLPPKVFANRGVNGIDGVLSSALGVSQGWQGSTFVLVGDLGFLHDVGSLVEHSFIKDGFGVVVVDNNGGGIFSFLPQVNTLDYQEFEKLFATPQNADILKITQGFGIDSVDVSTVDELRQQIKNIKEKKEFRILRIRTNRQENVILHKRIQDQFKVLLSEGIERFITS